MPKHSSFLPLQGQPCWGDTAPHPPASSFAIQQRFGRHKNAFGNNPTRESSFLEQGPWPTHPLQTAPNPFSFLPCAPLNPVTHYTANWFLEAIAKFCWDWCWFGWCLLLKCTSEPGPVLLLNGGYSTLSERSSLSWVYSGVGCSCMLQHTLDKLPAGTKHVWTMGRDNSRDKQRGKVTAALRRANPTLPAAIPSSCQPFRWPSPAHRAERG